ncbi:DNA-binding transcriptional LysR family regulator [Pseudomonas psychrotolerans]|nr:DNA-binding transcriptional LysR family regulator [Pseudomonas psychrotolerans]
MAFTLRQVRYFVATAEIGQISQAAANLHISQSAITSAIQETGAAARRRLVHAHGPGHDADR